MLYGNYIKCISPINTILIIIIRALLIHYNSWYKIMRNNSDHISKIRIFVRGKKVCLPIDVMLPKTKTIITCYLIWLKSQNEYGKFQMLFKGRDWASWCTSYIWKNAECGTCPFIAATSEQQILNDKIKKKLVN